MFIVYSLYSRFTENRPIWSWSTNRSFLRWFCHMGHQTSYNHPWSCCFSWPLDLVCFFWVVRSNNNINVMNQLLLFIDIIRGHTSEVSFTVNRHEHHMKYYLADGIYPSWPVFMKGVFVLQQEKHRFFSTKQWTLRKDVDCAFGLLKKRINILAILSRSYSQRTLGLIMRSYIVLHNMIIDDERDGNYDENYHNVTFVIDLPVNYDGPASLISILQREEHPTWLSMRGTSFIRLMYLFI
jgi:hypothetical protein